MSDSNKPSEKLTYLGKVDYRNKQIMFGIKEKDRTKHMYVIGKSGMGKSTFLENLAIQDINSGEGVCFIDPHGSTAEKLLDHIPESRIKDVVYFAPFDGDYPIGLNMLEKVAPEKRFLVANGLMSAFKKIFTDGDGKGTFSARMEYVLNNIILALLENEGQTLLGVNRMLFDKEYRKFIVSNVTDPTVKDFWNNEYANYTEKTAQDLAPSIQNKVGQFVSNPLIRNIIGQQKTSFDVRKLMDEKKIFIVNLSKGKVGEGNANLLGSLLITKIYLSAMSRADVDPYTAEKLPPFYFYVDEFQNFANESFASILSESRKYKLALTVAHQYIEQMTDEVRAAVFGNVGTMITFRVGATDAEIFEKEFAPTFIMDDFVNLSAFQIYLRLMIDNQGSKPFSAMTLGPVQQPLHSCAKAVIEHSRTTYGKPKVDAEAEIAEFYKPAPKVEKKKDIDPLNPTSAPASSPTYNAPIAEKQLPVRQIRNDTPLPPKQYDAPRNDSPKKFDVPPATHAPAPHPNKAQDQARQERRQEPRPRPTDDRPPRPRFEERPAAPKVEQTAPVQPVRFDEKPAMSLKDALAKALSESSPTPVKEMPVPHEVKEIETKKDEVVPSVAPKKVEEKPKDTDTSTTHTATESVARTVTQAEEKKKREISEEVLRKLLEE
jgi:hypothetical protein